MQNSASVKRWGRVIGRRADEFGLDAPALAAWHDDFQRALAGTVSAHASEHLIEARKHSFDIVIAPIFEDAAVVGVLGVNIDVTDVRDLQAQLVQSLKLESIGRVAGGIAHDFNNLLTAIVGYAEVAQARLGPESSEAADIKEIQRIAMRAAELTRQLLVFARKQSVVPRVVELDALVLSFEKMLRRVIGEHIELIVRTHSAPARIKADPTQIDQVLMNLAVNARDAMPTRGTLTIETSVTKVPAIGRGRDVNIAPGEYVSLRVGDTGIGIAPEVLAHVFEPFFTTKGDGAGTGLGLSTVYGIVRQAGGYIQVESRTGRGTVFSILLPRTRDSVETCSEAKPESTLLGGTETLLVVEDEPTVRRIATAELRARGYHVLEAANGVEALDLAHSYRAEIHCLLTDMQMPLMGGEELADRLERERPSLKVLFASGYAEDLRARREPRPDDVDYLAKPFKPSELSRRVRGLLDR
jgi:signal transduction histidine kinase